MIENIDLIPFCADAEWRPAIGSPWFVTERAATFATDGRLMVWVNGHHPQAVDNPELKRPSVDAAIMNQWHEEPRMPMPTLPAELRKPCEECGESGIVACKCPNCPDLQHQCQDCDGLGYWIERQEVAIGEASFSDVYLRKIAALPNLMIGTRRRDEPACFTFDGGQGMLMPVKTWEDKK